MKTPKKTVALEPSEISQLKGQYTAMSDLVQCYAIVMSTALDVVRRNPDKFEAMHQASVKAEDGIRMQLAKFKVMLDQAINAEIPEPLAPLTLEQTAIVAKLSRTNLKRIDAMLLAKASRHWQKVAAILGPTRKTLGVRYRTLPDAVYVERIIRLVKAGTLEAQGDLSFPRFSEVRLPA